MKHSYPAIDTSVEVFRQYKVPGQVKISVSGTGSICHSVTGPFLSRNSSNNNIPGSNRKGPDSSGTADPTKRNKRPSNFQIISVFSARGIRYDSFSYFYLYDLHSPIQSFYVSPANISSFSYFMNRQWISERGSLPVKINLCSIPLNGRVGIKFVNNSAGKYLVLINNTQEQAVVQKETEVSGIQYQQVATLHTGFYERMKLLGCNEPTVPVSINF